MPFVSRAIIAAAFLLTSTLFASLVVAQEPDTSSYKPIPLSAENPENPFSVAKVVLGQKLFSEKALSLNFQVSCARCHPAPQLFQDGREVSRGIFWQKGTRNAPTVINTALQFVQLWDGRAKDVEAQALLPLLDPVEMGLWSEQMAVDRLKYNKDYQFLFKEAFPGEQYPITFKNIGKAIGAFERIIIGETRFDRYLKGNKSELSIKEKEGLKVFNRVGCNGCHNGALLGGNSFQKLGVVKPYRTYDFGRYNVTRDPKDKYVFKVPSLRNVNKTDPYLHDGSVRRLEDMIDIMAEYQLGIKLSRSEIESIKDFLKCLDLDSNQKHKLY